MNLNIYITYKELNVYRKIMNACIEITQSEHFIKNNVNACLRLHGLRTSRAVGNIIIIFSAIIQLRVRGGFKLCIYSRNYINVYLIRFVTLLCRKGGKLVAQRSLPIFIRNKLFQEPISTEALSILRGELEFPRQFITKKKRNNLNLGRFSRYVSLIKLIRKYIEEAAVLFKKYI